MLPFYQMTIFQCELGTPFLCIFSYRSYLAQPCFAVSLHKPSFRVYSFLSMSIPSYCRQYNTDLIPAQNPFFVWVGCQWSCVLLSKTLLTHYTCMLTCRLHLIWAGWQAHLGELIWAWWIVGRMSLATDELVLKPVSFSVFFYPKP